MLENIRLISYFLHFSKESAESNFPNRDPIKYAVGNLYWLISYLIGTVTFIAIMELVGFNTIAQLWPYDFGELGSRNFLMPGVVFFLITLIICRWLVRRRYLNDVYFELANELYGNESLNMKCHKIALNIIYVNCIAIFVTLILKVWVLTILLLSVFVFEEIWIRHRFNE